MTLRLAALVVVLLGAFAPVAALAQAPVPLVDLERPVTGAFFDAGPWLDEVAGKSSVDSLGRWLSEGPVGVGVSVSPRRGNVDLPSAAVSAATRYRLAETRFDTTEIGLDLKLRWPSATDPTAGTVRPYVSVGPAVSVTPTDESPFVAATPRTDPLLPPMALGMRGALGLTWQVTRDASLFGEYRLTQERPFGSRTAGDVGVDLFYGLSIRF